MAGHSDPSTTANTIHDPINTISAVHQDVIRAHILTRLEGPALASACCASSLLHALSTEDNLWRHVCNREWPSTTDPRLRRLISTFPAGHRSFFSDSFPSLHHRSLPSFPYRHSSPPPPSNLISAVDINYQNCLIYSKVEETQTMLGLELCSQFRIDLLDPKETVRIPAELDYRSDECESDLGENLGVSWILIDPTRRRSANFSSLRSVRVDRNWLTGDIQVRFATVLGGERTGELVQCVVMVTCGGREEGDLQVREASLQMEGMDGKQLSWKDSLVILKESMEKGERRKRKAGEERERYEQFMSTKRERRERKQRRETRVELVCIATGVTIFVSFWMFVAAKIFQFLQL